MNLHHFSGRATAAPTFQIVRDTKICRFRLIRNEYAGSDAQGERREREVSIQFVAFGGKAEHIANNLMVGDQVSVVAAIRNNNYEKDGQMHYDYNFEVQDFEWGAPGAEKRAMLEARQNAG